MFLSTQGDEDGSSLSSLKPVVYSREKCDIKIALIHI